MHCGETREPIEFIFANSNPILRDPSSPEGLEAPSFWFYENAKKFATNIPQPQETYRPNFSMFALGTAELGHKSGHLGPVLDTGVDCDQTAGQIWLIFGAVVGFGRVSVL